MAISRFDKATIDMTSRLSSIELSSHSGIDRTWAIPSIQSNRTGSNEFQEANQDKPYLYAPRKVGEPWDECVKVLHKHDEYLCDGWLQEINGVMTFAGLFTAAVTGFSIQSYTWLKVDVPAPSSIRINILWFLSLIIAIATALFCLLFAQWIREYRRSAAISAQDAFRLRQLRHESLEKWGVPAIISSLSVLMQISLLLFVAGLLDLLWSLNHTVAWLPTTAMGLIVLVLAATTCLPSYYYLVHVIRPPWREVDWNKLFPCPYKSPQSRFFLKVVSFFLKFRPAANRSQETNSFLASQDWMQTDIWLVSQGKSVSSCSDATIWNPKWSTDNHLIRGMEWTIRNLGDAQLAKQLFHCMQESTFDTAPHILPLVPFATKSFTESSQGPKHSLHFSYAQWLQRFVLDDEFFRFRIELLLRCIKEDPNNDYVDHLSQELGFMYRFPRYRMDSLPEELVLDVVTTASSCIVSGSASPPSLYTWGMLSIPLLAHSSWRIRSVVEKLPDALESWIKAYDKSPSERAVLKRGLNEFASCLCDILRFHRTSVLSSQTFLRLIDFLEDQSSRHGIVGSIDPLKEFPTWESLRTKLKLRVKVALPAVRFAEESSPYVPELPPPNFIPLEPSWMQRVSPSPPAAVHGLNQKNGSISSTSQPSPQPSWQIPWQPSPRPPSRGTEHGYLNTDNGMTPAPVHAAVVHDLTQTNESTSRPSPRPPSQSTEYGYPNTDNGTNPAPVHPAVVHDLNQHNESSYIFQSSPQISLQLSIRTPSQSSERGHPDADGGMTPAVVHDLNQKLESTSNTSHPSPRPPSRSSWHGYPDTDDGMAP